MFPLRRIPSFFIATGLLLAACTSSGATAAPPTPVPANPSPPAAGAAVGVETTSLGTVLVGPAGRALYIHAGDGMNMSTCSGGCATAWPPLTIVSGQQPVAGSALTGQLGT